jgi:hypothetical protein
MLKKKGLKKVVIFLYEWDIHDDITLHFIVKLK